MFDRHTILYFPHLILAELSASSGSFPNRPPDATIFGGSKILKRRAQNTCISIEFFNYGLFYAKYIVVIPKQSNSRGRNCALDFPFQKIVKQQNQIWPATFSNSQIVT